MRRWIMHGLAALAALVAAAAPAAAKPTGSGQKLQASDPAMLSPGERAAVITDYRRRLAEEVAAQPEPGDSEARTALAILSAEAEAAAPGAFVGDYLCSVYGAIDGYLDTPGVYLYRSGTFSCVIERSGDGLRLRKTSGAPLDVMIDQPEPGVFTFVADYHSGLIMPERPWHVELVDPDTVRILPFETEMPGELARTEEPLTGADVNIWVLMRR